MSKIETSLVEELEDVYANNPDKLVLKYQFKDESNNTLMSNKLENLAFAVLGCASKAFMLGIQAAGFENVVCIEIHVNKSESKRLDLYKKMFSRSEVVDKMFPNEYADVLSDNKYITYYRWRSGN
jgi:hypothetical protein